MVCVHTYSESDDASLRYGHLKFSKMAAGRHLGKLQVAISQRRVIRSTLCLLEIHGRIASKFFVYRDL